MKNLTTLLLCYTVDDRLFLALIALWKIIFSLIFRLENDLIYINFSMQINLSISE